MSVKETTLTDILISAQRSNKAELLPADNLTQNEKVMLRDEVDSSAKTENNELYYGMFSALY